MTDDQEPEKVRRYDLMTNYRCGQSIEEMEPADDGEWVRYEQVESALAHLREERDHLKQQNEELKALLTRKEQA